MTQVDAAGTPTITSFSPVELQESDGSDGTTVVQTIDPASLGKSLSRPTFAGGFHLRNHAAAGIGVAASNAVTFSLACEAGGNGQIDDPDSCTGFVAGEDTGGHVVGCTSLVAIP